jgi:hypothetical protein
LYVTFSGTVVEVDAITAVLQHNEVVFDATERILFWRGIIWLFGTHNMFCVKVFDFRFVKAPLWPIALIFVPGTG